MRLAGIELRNFRSIGSEPVVLAPWKRCNVVIGQNNCGKSNAIRAVQLISTLGTSGGSPNRPADTGVAPTELDLHRLSQQDPFQFRVSFAPISPEDDELRGLARVESFWFDFSWETGSKQPTVIDNCLAYMDFDRANRLLHHLADRRFARRVGNDQIRAKFLERGASIFRRRFADCIPPAYIIPEFRQIQRGNAYELNGTELIRLLGRYQHPDSGNDQEDREKFEMIERFARQLLHLPHAILEVTHDKEKIMLTSDNLRLPLASYGTGVHELVILITAVLSVENAICCVEEPEIHMHPRLQREFIDFITTETTNSYLVSTHSATFIDAMNTCDEVQLFHLRIENGATVGSPILQDRDGLAALHDLGVKASDILQSNCVIWVEGPSDRVYLNRWLHLAEPRLAEGRDYSIMFYGGSLRSHLGVNRDSRRDDLIELLRINQNAVVVMDNDRSRPREHLNPTKLRVRRECERSGSICWVTDGREIENYLPERVVAAACRELTGKQIRISVGPYDRFEETLSRALSDAGAKNLDYAADKVKHARKFVQHFELADMTGDLRKRIGEIVVRVKCWNE